MWTKGVLAPVDNSRRNRVWRMRDFALGADAHGVVGDAAAVGPSARAAARAERDPAAVGCMRCTQHKSVNTCHDSTP